jgi:hypothetical protein
MNEFILRNLISIGEKDIGGGAIVESESFFKNSLYHKDNFEFEDGNLIIQRGRVGKGFWLEADDSSGKEEAKNFPIYFKFEFSKKYVVSFSEGEYKLEEA